MSVVHMILLIDPQSQVGRVMFFCKYVINAFNFDGEASFFALQLFFFLKKNSSSFTKIHSFSFWPFAALKKVAELWNTAVAYVVS